MSPPIEFSCPPKIDALQYCAWSEATFREMKAGELSAVHATVCYHENFRETAAVIGEWHQLFHKHQALITPGRRAYDILRAQKTGRTAIFFGAQNPSVMEDDIRLIAPLREMGLSFMQLTYNNQSLLGGGCMERDAGLTRMGREVLLEMNRVGLIADLSHAGAQTCMDAIQHSTRPVAITHANPKAWHDCPRNLPNEVLQALAEKGGVIGLSLYPHHLKNGTDCSLESFCEMAAALRELIGADAIGIGSDLCRGRPDSAVQWMRDGKWTLNKSDAAFPAPPAWFESAADFPNLERGLAAAGFDQADTDALLGGNWGRFLVDGLTRQ